MMNAVPEPRAPVYVYRGSALAHYSFGNDHPFGPDRHDAFQAELAGRVERIQLEVDGAQGEELQLFRVELPAVPEPEGEQDDADPQRFQARGVREGRQAKEIARRLIEACGFDDVREDVKPPRLGIELNLVATDKQGNDWAFDVSGAFTSTRAAGAWAL